MEDKTHKEDKSHKSALSQRTFFERSNFYFGKLMTAQDFTDEQRYFNEKRWMINRFGLGWGVLCGLKVRPHDYDKDKVIVEPGFAIDPFGHEIMVCREEIVDLTPAHDDYPPDKETYPPEPPIYETADQAMDKTTKKQKSHLYYVSIKYEECKINPSPIPLDSCDGYKEECAYNRIREGYRFVVSREKPDLTPDQHDCFRFLQDPSPAISNSCPERGECEPVPLASVCYDPKTETTPKDIDMSMANRKLAFSNEILYDLIRCLQEAGLGQAGQYDRRQHVPLLASTIKGLKFQDGKIAKLDHSNGFTGQYPFRLTSDGDYIWITDREDEQIWRIDRRTNTPIKDQKLALDDPAFGIAYDSQYMWITHHGAFEGPGETRYGKLTRVNVSTLRRHTFGSMPRCVGLSDCYSFPEKEGKPDKLDWLKPYPGEIVLHDGDIYVAHDLRIKHSDQEQQYGQEQQPGQEQQYDQEQQQRYGQSQQRYKLSLTRIDPVKGCIVETIDIPETDNREPWSRIRAMASDGHALWITYQASSRDKQHKRVVVRKITKDKGKSVVGNPFRLKDGDLPEHMVFDGTRLWISHNDGVSKINVETGKEGKTIDSESRHTAMAYGGGELIWAALPGGKEASINWINIFSKESEQWLQLVEIVSKTDATFEISDMQFDGTYIYVAYHFEQGQVKKGVIHRLLP